MTDNNAVCRCSRQDTCCHHHYQSTPVSRQRVAAQAAKAQVELSRMLGIKVEKSLVELAQTARF